MRQPVRLVHEARSAAMPMPLPDTTLEGVRHLLHPENTVGRRHGGCVAKPEDVCRVAQSSTLLPEGAAPGAGPRPGVEPNSRLAANPQSSPHTRRDRGSFRQEWPRQTVPPAGTGRRPVVPADDMRYYATAHHLVVRQQENEVRELPWCSCEHVVGEAILVQCPYSTCAVQTWLRTIAQRPLHVRQASVRRTGQHRARLLAVDCHARRRPPGVPE